MSLPEAHLRPPLRPKSLSSRGILSSSTKQNISKPLSLSSTNTKRRNVNSSQTSLGSKRSSSAQAKENQPQNRTGKLTLVTGISLHYRSSGADFWQKEKEEFLRQPLPLKQSKIDERRVQRTRSSGRSRPVTPTVVEGSRLVESGLIESSAAADVISSVAGHVATNNASASPTPIPLASLPESSIESPGCKIASSEDSTSDSVVLNVSPECPVTLPLASGPEAVVLTQLVTTPSDDPVVDTPVEEVEPKEATNTVVGAPKLGDVDSTGTSIPVLRVPTASWNDTDVLIPMSRSEVLVLSQLISTSASDLEQETVASEMKLEEPQASTEDAEGAFIVAHDTSSPLLPPPNHDDIASIPSIEEFLEQAPQVPTFIPPAPYCRVVVSDTEDIALSRLISTIPDFEDDEQKASEGTVSSENRVPSWKDAEPTVSSIVAGAVPPSFSKDEDASRASHKDGLMLQHVQATTKENIPATPFTDQPTRLVPPRPSRSLPVLPTAAEPQPCAVTQDQPRPPPPVVSMPPHETSPVDSLSLSTSIALFCPRFLLAPLLEAHSPPQKKSPWKKFGITWPFLPIPVPCTTAPSSGPANVSSPQVEEWKVAFPSPAQASVALHWESSKKGTLNLPKGYTSTPLDVSSDGASGWSVVESTSMVPFEHHLEEVKTEALMQPKRVTFDVPASESSCASSFDPYVASGFCDYITNNESHVSLADRLCLSPPSSPSVSESFELVDKPEAGDSVNTLDEYVIVDDPKNSVPYPDVFDLDQYFAGWDDIGDPLDDPDVPLIVVIPPIEDAVLVSGVL